MHSPLVDQLIQNFAGQGPSRRDFKHGMDGDVPLTKQQPATLCELKQIAQQSDCSRNQNVQSIQQQSALFIKTIDDVLSSEAFKGLNTDKAE